MLTSSIPLLVFGNYQLILTQNCQARYQEAGHEHFDKEIH